ncbi:uncharacterized protein N7477_004280 [Penicillium maclennaniae]|uniref:uncharacterized protein n=1 Tax=Penicillium maclennaniae TaxID=1343394 RepID=UPI0025424283|nr:uncharacterized protein N7477_004280 [Penicillium maclennaniae]KAJ5674346.1 hypothetical protein N7477_004280 [Penicillium maclennaniae]
MLPPPTVESVNAALAPPSNHCDISRVRFAYNYLNEIPKFLKPQGLEYNTVPGLKKSVKSGQRLHFTTPNAFTLDPVAAGLPWPTGLDCIRQGKFWQSGLSISSELLELFARDENVSQAVKSNGKSLGSVAAHELNTLEEDRFTKFATYLFPEADEARMRLLAASIVYIVIFDDAWEMVAGSELNDVRDGFLDRLQGRACQAPESDLQALITSTVDGFHEQDALVGNGGQEVIDRLVDFCKHVPPAQKFDTLGDYLTYRRIDAGVPYILACVKFSICSNVEIESPQLEKFLRLISDHVSIRLFSMPTENSAKALTYAMQLEIEVEIDQELARMRDENTLTAEEWQFVDAVLTMTAGNVFYSVVSSRYGGESTRIPE